MAEITIVGLGISGVDQVTRETERALRAAREVLFVDAGVATGEYLASLCPVVSALREESYEHEGRRVDAYAHMAARVVERALENAPVVFAMPGHPLVFCYAPFLIRDMSTALGLSVRALPGVSASACLLADLWVDPSVHGLQSYEATDLLLRRRPLQLDVPAMIWQAGTVETTLHSTRPSRPARFTRLRDHLLGAYPAAHPVTAYHASPHPLAPTSRTTFPLVELCEQAAILHAGVTLYLPAAQHRAIEDRELLAQVADPEHLRRISR